MNQVADVPAAATFCAVILITSHFLTMKNKISFFIFSLTLLAVLIFHVSSVTAQNIPAPGGAPEAGKQLVPGPSGKLPAAGNADQKNPEEKEKKGLTEFQKLLAMIGVVTGFLLLLFFLLRKLRPDYPKPLPREIFEILGKASIGFNQQVVLLRCGRKIFLTAISSLGVERVGEITDPAEVEYLVRICGGQNNEKKPISERGFPPERIGTDAFPKPAETPVRADSRNIPISPAGEGKQKMSFDEIYQQVVGEQRNR